MAVWDMNYCGINLTKAPLFRCYQVKQIDVPIKNDGDMVCYNKIIFLISPCHFAKIAFYTDKSCNAAC